MGKEVKVVISGPNHERTELAFDIPEYPNPAIDTSAIEAAIVLADHSLRRTVEKVLREHASVPHIRELETPGIPSALATDILQAIKEWLER